MSKINESYIVGFDVEDEQDMSVAVVLRRDKDGLRQVNVFEGDEAEDLYLKLTNCNFSDSRKKHMLL